MCLKQQKNFLQLTTTNISSSSLSSSSFSLNYSKTYFICHSQVGTPKDMTSKTGKPLKKCEVKVMDDGCNSFSLLM